VILIHVSCNVELSSCKPISSDQVFLLRLWFWSAFRILRSILEIDHWGCSCSLVARGVCLTFREISTCLWTHPRLTRTNRGVLWQNGGSERRSFSESDGKPWFKEAFSRLNLLFLLCSELQQRLDPISLDWFIYPPLSLATSGFHRFDSFSRCYLRLDA
jgi:hypothetical protein